MSAQDAIRAGEAFQIVLSLRLAASIVHWKASGVTHGGRGIFRGMPAEFEAGRYHSLPATQIPAKLEVSARCAEDERTAVRHRDLPVDGVQFHPESVLTLLGPQLARSFLEGT